MTCESFFLDQILSVPAHSQSHSYSAPCITIPYGKLSCILGCYRPATHPTPFIHSATTSTRCRGTQNGLLSTTTTPSKILQTPYRNHRKEEFRWNLL